MPQVPAEDDRFLLVQLQQICPEIVLPLHAVINASQRLQSRISKADILSQVMGSDHCPVSLELNI